MIIGAPLFCRRLVGREREFATLRERFQEAVHSRGSLVIVNGEAGIGKTRFLLEVLQELRAAGVTCLRSQFFEHVSTPMGPLVEIFRELYKILPTAIDKHSTSASFGSTDGSDNVIFDSRASQFASIAETLLRCAAATPLVIAIEDVHWADPATLECLQYLASRVEGARQLFVLTYRSASPDHRQSPTPEFSKLAHQANVWQLALEPLENAEMQALVNETVPADHQLSAEDRFRILELAGGNPLFAEELLRDSLEPGLSRKLPASISVLFLKRLESFSAEGRLLLSQAAVIGKRFNTQLLAQVSKQSFEAILTVLRSARQLQLIIEDVAVPSSYNFRHALVREALYEELLADEARDLHQRIAGYLEKLPESEERTIELAYHWWVARAPAKAVQYNEAAAKIAAARFASEDAARYYDRALEFVVDGSLVQAELRDSQAQQLWASSQGSRAIDVLMQSFESFERHGLTDRFAEIANRLGYYHVSLGRGDHMMWWERALQAMGDNKAHPRRANCLLNLAGHNLMRGSQEQARVYVAAAEESLFAARPVDRAFHSLHLVFFAQASGEFDSALAAYQRFRSEFDDPKWETESTVQEMWRNIANTFLNFGALDIADHALERVRLAEQAHPSLRSFTECTPVVVEALMFGGRFADAAELVREYWAKQTTETMSSARKYMAHVAAPLAARLLNPDLLAEIGADEMLELAFDSADNEMIFARAASYAEWYAATEERTRARELIARALGIIGDHVMVYPDCAVAFALYGDSAAGRWAHDMLARWATPASNRIGRAYLALVDAIALGARPPRTAKLARAAAEGFRDAGLPYFEALALERCGDKKQALEIYRRIGDERDARRLAAEIDPMNSRGRRAAELTAREREIADLIAEGNSNHAIAEKLVLSQRTVETHVASIFSKLEISERGGVADRVAQHR